MNQRRDTGDSAYTRFIWLSLLLILSVAGPSSAQAQGLTEDQIKAGFLFNFLRFVEWPASAYANTSTPISVCILGGTQIDVLLQETSTGKAIGGRAVLVRRVRANEDLRTCHLLFFAPNEAARSSALLAKLADANTLTVGDNVGFAKAGGILGFAREDNRVKLELNLRAATRANLKISAKLIAVSRLISDQHATEGN